MRAELRVDAQEQELEQAGGDERVQGVEVAEPEAALALQLAESLMAHDEYFGLWRVHHIKMVERMVGTKRGTGGSEGVGYLKTTLDKKFFPEFWEARTHLDTKHGAAGCPFAGGA